VHSVPSWDEVEKSLNTCTLNNYYNFNRLRATQQRGKDNILSVSPKHLKRNMKLKLAIDNAVLSFTANPTYLGVN